MSYPIRVVVVAALVLLVVGLGVTAHDWHSKQETERYHRDVAWQTAACIVPLLSTAAKTSIASEMHSPGHDPYSDVLQFGYSSSDAISAAVSAAEKERCPRLAVHGYVVAAVREQLARDAEFQTIEPPIRERRRIELEKFKAERAARANEAAKKDAWLFKQ